MAREQGLQKITLPVTADLSASQYCFVKDSSGSAALCGAGQQALGVLQNDPAASGRPGSIAFGGISKVKFGGTVAANGYIASDANGKAVAAASGDFALGIAIDSAVDGDIGSAQVMPGIGKVW